MLYGQISIKFDIYIVLRTINNISNKIIAKNMSSEFIPSHKNGAMITSTTFLPRFSKKKSKTSTKKKHSDSIRPAIPAVINANVNDHNFLLKAKMGNLISNNTGNMTKQVANTTHHFNVSKLLSSTAVCFTRFSSSVSKNDGTVGLRSLYLFIIRPKHRPKNVVSVAI